MTKVDTRDGYDFYLLPAMGDRLALYNIVPAGSPAPTSGYYNMRHVEKIKGVRFPDRYRHPWVKKEEQNEKQIASDQGVDKTPPESAS